MRICSVEDCESRHLGRGFCQRHLYYFNLYGDPLLTHELLKPKYCLIDECPTQPDTRGYCRSHYYRLMRYGDPLGNTLKKLCSIDDCESEARCRGLCHKHYCRWRAHGDPNKTYSPNWGKGHINKHGYRNISVGGTHHLEHRLIMEEHLGRSLRQGETVHHKNGIRQDNRIENLELWASAHARGQRVLDLIEFAEQVLSQYKKESELL